MKADRVVFPVILSGSEESWEAGCNPHNYCMRPHSRFFVVLPVRTPQNDIDCSATYLV